MPDSQLTDSRLDYFGVVPACGCLTAWLMSTASPVDVQNFKNEMQRTGRRVERMELTDENRARLTQCPHGDAA